MYKSNDEDFKIDLVYTWCDGTDPKFQAKKAKAAGKSYDIHAELNGQHHIMQADELMYSLRSIEKNMPWINRIFIIVDNQIPNFLDIKNKQITIVDLKDIFPKDALPNFNTNAIETVMGKIEGLSEYFILASDDMMVNKPVEKGYFYTSDRKPIIHIANKKIGYDWYNMITFICNAEINQKPINPCIQDLHNMTPHIKSDYNDVIEHGKYKRVFENTVYSQFRSYFNIQRILIYLILEKQNKVIFKHLGNSNGIRRLKDQMYVENSSKWLVDIFKPYLFCINASRKQTQKQIQNIKDFLNKKFNTKSTFEK